MTAAIRKLAIVGASARAAAFSALNAGFEVATADLFADADLARECDATRIEHYPEGLADWLAASGCDAWLYTGALENHPDLVDRMATLRPLLGIRGESLRHIRDPLWLQSELTSRGLSFPQTRSTPEGLPLDGSWLCKTYRGASGSGVWRLDGPEAIDLARERTAWFQRYVAGESLAAVFVVAGHGSRLLGVTHQTLSRRHEWQYSGSLGPADIRPSVAAQLDAFGSLLHMWNLRGIVGLDFLTAGNTAVAVEVNPRFTASVEIVERLAGCSAVAAHVSACTSAAAPLVTGSHIPQGHSHVAKVILYAQRDVVITSQFHHWAMTFASLDPQHRTLADIPNANEVIPADRPVLTALASGASRAECQQRLADRLADVEVRLYCGQ